MLYKKELSEIPVGDMPEIDAPGSYMASARVVERKRSGRILVVDYFRKDKKAIVFRFCTDGKNYLTVNHDNGGAWTEQNPRARIGYEVAGGRAEDVKIARQFLNAEKWHQRDLLSIVDRFIDNIRGNRRQRELDRKETLRKQHFDMYPLLPENISAFCETHLFNAYIFISTLDKHGIRHGRCSHCNSEYEVPRDARSGQPASCPVCGKSAVYRATWIKTDIENKTKVCIAARVDGQILLRWTDAVRRFSHPDFQAKYEFDDYAYNLFLQTEKGPKTYFYKWAVCGHFYGGWDWYRGRIGDLCYDNTAIYTDNLHGVFGQRYCGVDLQQVLSKTHGRIPFASLLDNLKNIPATEYLLKLGMVNLAKEVRAIPGAMACKKPSFSRCLGVDAQLQRMYSQMDITLWEHKVIQRYGKYVSQEQMEEYRALGIEPHDTEKVQQLLAGGMSFQKFLHYFQKQKRLSTTNGIGKILTCYRDYIQMSETMGVDLSHKGTRFPRDCVAAHNLIVARYNQVKHEREDKHFAETVKAIYEKLRCTAFEKSGFCIVLPQRRSDLITEGQSLNHCVGTDGYYRNHLAGTKLIFFVREIANRGKPFFTMEVDMTDYHICQLYGFGDCSAPDDVQKFANEFVKKLTPAKVLRKAS